jgi:hypothetical protein
MDEIGLDHGERIILKTQGTMQFRSTWQLGHLFLTSRRLIFVHAAKIAMECGLDRIAGMRIMQRNWLLGIKVKQLCIEINCGNGCDHLYIALAKPDELTGIIKQSMTLMLVERRGCNGTEPESPGNT